MTTFTGQYRFSKAAADGDDDLWMIKITNNVDNDQASSDHNPNHDGYKAAQPGV